MQSIQQLRLNEPMLNTTIDTNRVMKLQPPQDEDLKRISLMKALPKAVLVKQLIGKRKTMANRISRKEMSAVS